MLTSNFKENIQSEIKLPGKRLEDIIELLKMIYPNFIKKLDGKYA
jgi:hypothetical protein